MTKRIFTLFFALATMITTVNAQVVFDETNFPDPNFRAALAEILVISEGDEITAGKIASTNSLDVSEKFISDLTGIEHFTALTYLDCYANQLTSLDVSKNTALTYLDCYANQLTSLDVSQNTALTNLFCYINRLTSLDVSKNTALIEMACNNNQLTSLDVSKNTALGVLYCWDNQLTSLDVSNNTELYWLDCDNNQLTSLDVSKNIELESFACNDNQLTSLNVSDCTAMTSLECDNNQLTSLDVSKNTALRGLTCENNQLTSLDVSKNTALVGLGCSSNELTSLDVSKNIALQRLDCYSNLIKGEAMDALVASLPMTEDGDFYIIDTKDENEGNVCTKTQVAVAKGKGWTVYDNNGGKRPYPEYEGSDEEIVLDEENFSDANFREALAEILNIAEGDEISEEFIKNLTTLDVSEKTIADLSGIEYFTALTTLYCHINQIKNVKMTALITALPDLSDNEAKGMMRTEGTNPRKGALYALDFTADDEQNVCTAEHVAAANAKGWTVYCKTTNGWQEYTGEVPTGIGASLNDNGKMINDNYYSIDGVKLSSEPTKKGLYIHKGKKVVK